MPRQFKYEVVKASPFEVGLVMINESGTRLGVKTWWAKEFGGKLPSLSHPIIQQTIEDNEKLWEME